MAQRGGPAALFLDLPKLGAHAQGAGIELAHDRISCASCTTNCITARNGDSWASHWREERRSRLPLTPTPVIRRSLMRLVEPLRPIGRRQRRTSDEGDDGTSGQREACSRSFDCLRSIVVRDGHQFVTIPQRRGGNGRDLRIDVRRDAAIRAALFLGCSAIGLEKRSSTVVSNNVIQRLNVSDVNGVC
jgi:hypothetical protein